MGNRLVTVSTLGTLYPAGDIEKMSASLFELRIYRKQHTGTSNNTSGNGAFTSVSHENRIEIYSRLSNDDDRGAGLGKHAFHYFHFFGVERRNNTGLVEERRYNQMIAEHEDQMIEMWPTRDILLDRRDEFYPETRGSTPRFVKDVKKRPFFPIAALVDGRYVFEDEDFRP